jgi:tetratricopeptide (TPR) repeat protein
MFALFGLIYFGLNTKPKAQRDLEMSRSATIEATGIQNIVMESKKTLTKDEMNVIEAMQTEFQNAASDSDKVEKAKNLASKWYEFGAPIVSGYYAEEIAKIENTKEAWSICGTTYSIGINNSKTEKNIQFAKGRAVKAFETAITLSDDNITDKINLALIYIDHPDENPMQGIQMLLKLNESNPENVQVLNQLARLGIQTNQFDKAIQRLQKALSLEPENNNSICLIALAYEKSGQVDLAKEFQDKCKK